MFKLFFDDLIFFWGSSVKQLLLSEKIYKKRNILGRDGWVGCVDADMYESSHKEHGSTASMEAGCLVGWLFGCLAGSLLRCLGCSRLVCVCACNRTKITKSWQNKSHTCGLPLEMHRAPVPCSWKRHQRASPAKRHMSGVYRITLYLSWALTAYINMLNTHAVPT